MLLREAVLKDLGLWGPINPSGGVPRMLTVQPAEQRAEKSAQGGPDERKHGAGLDSD